MGDGPGKMPDNRKSPACFQSAAHSWSAHAIHHGIFAQTGYRLWTTLVKLEPEVDSFLMTEKVAGFEPRPQGQTDFLKHTTLLN